MIEDCTSFDSVGACSSGGFTVMRPFCAVKIRLKDMLKYILPLKMFRKQNGLVDPTEVPLPIGLSWVTKIKTDNHRRKKMFRSK